MFTFEEDSRFYRPHRVSLILVLTLVTAMTSAPAQEVASEWRPFTPPEGDFSVVTPAPLEKEGEKTFSSESKGRKYVALNGGNAYLVSVVPWTFGVTEDFIRAFLKGFGRNLCLQITANGKNCYLANESASSIQGVPVRQYSVLRNEVEVGVVRFMFGVKRVYVCGAIGKPFNHPNATRFIDSFTVAAVALREMTASPPPTGDPVKEALERGDGALAARRYEEAEREFRQALALNPQEARAYLGLGNIRLVQGQHEQGVEAFRQAIRIDPNLANAHYNLGVLYTNRGSSYSLFVDKDSILKKHEAYGQATEAFLEAARINPNFADAHYNLGIVHRFLYKDKEAAEAFLRALALYQVLLMGDPKSVLLHYRSGLAALWSGKRVEALEQYRALQQLDSSFADKLMVEINRHGGPTKKQ